MNKEQLETALDKALVIERDKHLLAVDASEKSMSHHIAIYLAEQIVEYNVDCEYNKDGFNTKQLHIEPPSTNAFDDTAVTVFPDIIVHRRGDNDHNLFVIEMKKYGSWRDSSFDRAKLKAFRGELKYQWAAQLIVGLGDESQAIRSVEWVE